MSSLEKRQDEFLRLFDGRKIKTLQDVSNAVSFYSDVVVYFKMMHYALELYKRARIDDKEGYLNVGWMARDCDAKSWHVANTFCELLFSKGVLRPSGDGKKNWIVQLVDSAWLSSIAQCGHESYIDARYMGVKYRVCRKCQQAEEYDALDDCFVPVGDLDHYLHHIKTLVTLKKAGHINEMDGKNRSLQTCG